MKIISIDGYWNDTKETFSEHKCRVGATEEQIKESILNGTDHDYFYDFEDMEEVNWFKLPENAWSEFVITRFEELN